MMIRNFFFSLLLLLGTVVPLSAQQIAGLDVQADNLQFEQEVNTVTATGNVVLRKGAQSLKADVITYNTVTEQAFARGNVVFTNEDQIWEGDQLSYNFLTGEGSFPDLKVVSGPFTVNAARVERLSPVQTRLEDVVVTTCPDPVDPEFSITSGKVDVFEEEIYLMRNAVFRLHGVPFFWVPSLTVDQKRQPTNLDVTPGYSSRNGVMLLNTYNRYPSEGYSTKTHVDFRSERGFAVGQDWYWRDAEQDTRETSLKLYGALDDAPYKNETQQQQLNDQGIEVEEERYRIKFDHRQQLTGQDGLWIKANYLSDARVVNDFFEDEFREEPVPETRATYSAVGDGWNAAIDGVMQLNDDDFESVNRLPEATFNVPLVPLADSGFFYESESAAGYLEKTYTAFQRESGLEEYDSLRLHTAHTVSYPTKVNGWLNVIPRAGVAATYYDSTKGTREEITTESVADENGIITSSFSTNRVESVEGADIRLLPEIGLETSFKAFGIVHENPTSMGEGMRHVVEPFLNYTFIPEPGLEPAEIFQFDDIDTLGEAHNVAFGLRNKWQTRRHNPGQAPSVHDLVNFNIQTRYDLRSDVDPSLGDIELDLAWYPTNWFRTRIKADYNSDTSTVEEVNSEIRFRDPETQNLFRIDQQYFEDVSHTLQFTYHWNPNERFGFRGYTRLELEEDGAEEQAVTFIIKTDCVGYGIGGRWQRGENYADGTTDEDDYEIYLQFWLRAFPRAVLGTGAR